MKFFAAFSILSLATFGLAAPTAEVEVRTTPANTGQVGCGTNNAGTVSCCNTKGGNPSSGGLISGLLSGDILSAKGCSTTQIPVTLLQLVGLGIPLNLQNQCTNGANAVCCQNQQGGTVNNGNGLVNLGLGNVNVLSGCSFTPITV